MMVNTTLFLRLFLRCLDSTVSRRLLSIYSSAEEIRGFHLTAGVFSSAPFCVLSALHRTDYTLVKQVPDAFFPLHTQQIQLLLQSLSEHTTFFVILAKDGEHNRQLFTEIMCQESQGERYRKQWSEVTEVHSHTPRSCLQ